MNETAKNAWIEMRVDEIVNFVDAYRAEHPDSDLEKSIRNYIKLVGSSNEIDRDVRQEARMKPILFIQKVLQGIAVPIASQEHDAGCHPYTNEELPKMLCDTFDDAITLIANREAFKDGSRRH